MKNYMLMGTVAVMSLALSACQTTGMSTGTNDPIQQRLNQAAYVDATSACGEIKHAMSTMTDVIVAADNAAVQQNQDRSNNRAINSAATSSSVTRDIPFLRDALRFNSDKSSANFSKLRQQGQMARREKSRLSQIFSSKDCK